MTADDRPVVQPDRLRVSSTIYDKPNGQKVLTYPVDPSTNLDPEEVVVNIQGYLVKSELPPIVRRDR